MKKLFGLLLLLPLLCSAQTNVVLAKEHLQAGLQAEKQQQFESALVEYRKVIELAPDQVAGFAKVGQTLMTLGRYSEALDPLKHASALDESSVPVHRLLGYALLSQGYWKESALHLEKCNDRGALGIAQLQNEQPLEAVTNLQAALAERPNDPDLLFYLARAGEMLSSQTMNALMAQQPESARAHQVLGKNFYSIRQYNRAAEELQVAMKLRPDLPEIHLELGQVYAESSQWDNAVREFRAQLERQPGNPEALYRLGDALLQQGSTAEALEYLRRANELRPDMTETLYAMGKAASATGNDKLAEESWSRVTVLEKAGSLSAQAHFGLAGIYRKQRKVELAAKEMEAFRRLKAEEAPPKTAASQPTQTN